MSKIKRQTKIIELVKNNVVETQEEIGEFLKNEGFDVTQATISRDIRELKLTKIAASAGKQKYVTFDGPQEFFTEKTLSVFRDGIKSVDFAGNIVVIRTLPGMAMAVGVSVDGFGFDNSLGCIAGYDNIFCVTRNEKSAVEIAEKLRSAARKDD